MTSKQINEFLKITQQLNQLAIIPLIMGSVGLEIVTQKDWQAQDIDIHVPGTKGGWEIPAENQIHQWFAIISVMESLGYQLADLHEHEFVKDGLSVGFASVNTLPPFAGIELSDLKLKQQNNLSYYLLSSEQFLSVYKSSSKDSYRSDKNNHKDLKKIEYLEALLEN